MAIQKEHKEFYKVDLDRGWEKLPGYPDGIGQQVRSEPLAGASLGVVEQPPDVCVAQTPQSSPPAAAVVDMGAVGVAEAIGVCMMLAVVGDPRDDRTLDRHRPENGKQAA